MVNKKDALDLAEQLALLLDPALRPDPTNPNNAKEQRDVITEILKVPAREAHETYAATGMHPGMALMANLSELGNEDAAGAHAKRARASQETGPKKR